jgi:hypothetical protein
MERLNFYFIPSDIRTRQTLFLSINIYSKYHYRLEPEHRRLLETTRYIFTVHLSNGSTLRNETDIAIFNTMRTTASNDQYLINLIRLYRDDEKLFDNTIWVNGRQLNTKAITDRNVTYLPIREVCENLGYRVGWLSEQNAVTLRRGNSYELLLKNDINVNRGFTLLFHNNTTYISSLYFLTVLKLNVEIDERKNVILNES